MIKLKDHFEYNTDTGTLFYLFKHKRKLIFRAGWRSNLDIDDAIEKFYEISNIEEQMSDWEYQLSDTEHDEIFYHNLTETEKNIIHAIKEYYKIMHIPSDQYDSFDFSNIADLVNLDKPTIEEFVHKYHNTIL